MRLKRFYRVSGKTRAGRNDSPVQAKYTNSEIRPLPKQRKLKRPIGQAKGKFKVPAEFYEPLPTELLDAFHGGKPSPDKFIPTQRKQHGIDPLPLEEEATLHCLGFRLCTKTRLIGCLYVKPSLNI
jgi:hypothetical protein